MFAKRGVARSHLFYAYNVPHTLQAFLPNTLRNLPESPNALLSLLFKNWVVRKRPTLSKLYHVRIELGLIDLFRKWNFGSVPSTQDRIRQPCIHTPNHNKECLTLFNVSTWTQNGDLKHTLSYYETCLSKVHVSGLEQGMNLPSTFTLTLRINQVMMGLPSILRGLE